MQKLKLPLLLFITLLFTSCLNFENEGFTKRQYLSLGTLTSDYQEFIGFDEKPSSAYFPYFELVFDQDKKVREISYYAKDKLKPLDPLLAYPIPSSKMVISYQDNKEIRHFFDHNKRPTFVNGDIYKQIITYKDNRKSVLSNYSRKGELIEDKFGVASIVWEVLSKDTVIETRFNISGEPIKSAENPRTLVFGSTQLPKKIIYPNHLEELLYYQGKISTKSFFSISGEPITKSGAMHSLRFAYDTLAQLNRIFFNDIEGNLLTNPLSNHTSDAFFYDDVGNLIRVEHHDINGNLVVPQNQNFAYRQRFFDPNGFIVEESFYNANKKAASNKKGYHKIKRDLDEWGNPIRVFFYNKQNTVVKYESEPEPVYRTVTN
jgi:hypothetical protein